MLGHYVNLFTDTKTEDELETLQDKWFFLFRHLQERIFNSLFKHANIAQFKPEERIAYESSLKYYRDLTNVVDTARTEGREEGRQEGIELGYQKARAEAEKRLQDMVLNMLQAGLPDSQVMSIAQITADELATIKEQI